MMPGRPTIKEHRHPFDEVRKPLTGKSGPSDRMNVLTLVAGEQQTMNFYMNVGNTLEDSIGRGLYLEIAQIEEQHVTQYESLLDPGASWYEMMVMHEYNECYLYHAFMEQEVDADSQKGLGAASCNGTRAPQNCRPSLLKQYGKKDAEDLLPSAFPKPIVFQPNIDYVRDVLE